MFVCVQMKGLTERESYAFNRAAQNEVAYMRQVVTEAYNIVKDREWLLTAAGTSISP